MGFEGRKQGADLESWVSDCSVHWCFWADGCEVGLEEREEGAMLGRQHQETLTILNERGV